MRETRGLLLLLILVGLSTCQRLGDSQQGWTSSSSRHHLPSNVLYQARPNHDNRQPHHHQQPQQQQHHHHHSQSQQSQQLASDSVEYYDDDEYYDEEEELPASSSAAVRDDSREPKSARASASQENSAANNTSAAYEDSYYYDDDYEELPVSEEASQQSIRASDESAQPQLASEEKQPIADSREPEAAINRSSSTSPPPPPQAHNEARQPEEEEEDEELPTSSSISPETSSTSTTTTTSSTTEKVIEEKEEEEVEEEVKEHKRGEESILIGEAIVSVVTTKSVVNGTFSVPEETTTNPPQTTVEMMREKEDEEEEEEAPTVEATPSSSTTTTTDETPSTTSPTSTTPSTTTVSAAPSTTTSTSTESSLSPASSTIQPSVQTGRSVSGARFLPFPSVVDKAEQLDSTESIIDKLDRVQSELSSGFLANGRFVPRRYNKKPFSATSLTLPTTSTTISPTSSPIPPVSITTITKRPKLQTTLDDIAAFLPKDFPKSLLRTISTTTSTTAPLTKRPKFQTTLDDIEAFLPKGYKISTTSGSGSTTTTTTKRPKFQTTLDDVEAFLPKDFPKSGYRGYKRPSYKTTVSTSSTTSTATRTVPSSTEKSTGSTGRKALTTIEDISSFLPPGYKLKKEDLTTEKSVVLSEILAKTKNEEPSSTAASTSTTTSTDRPKSIQDLFAKSTVDISALLPPGFKPDTEASSPKSNSTEVSDDPIEKLLTKSVVDLSALLPAGFKPDAAKSTKSIKSGDPVQELLAKSNVDIAALLPPGFKPEGDSTEESTVKSGAAGGSSFKVVFPSRPGGRKPISHKTTTPRAAAAAEASPKIQKGWPVRATTEFTGWPTSSTTPISIEKLLEAARTATVSSTNVSLVPSAGETTSTSSTTTTTTTTTMRPTTPGLCDEECEVAGTIKIVENATWMPELLDRNTREWQDLAEEIEREMNLVFAKSPVLRKWFRNIRIDSFSQGSVLVDYFVELSDLKERINTQQLKVIFHDSLRTFNFDNPMEPARPKGPMKLGKFTIDPKSTDFVVIPRVAAPKISEDENRLIPQWAIAVIVIGVGGLLFIIVFGVSVLVNRQQRTKLRPTTMGAMYDEKNVLGHHATAAPPPSRPSSDYQKHVESHTMWSDVGWHDKPFESTSHKILVDGLPYEGRKYNMYDSWKSEWNGYYYPPTQASGSNFSRHHHPDYDINF